MLEVIGDDIYFNKRLIAKFYNNINLSNRRDFESFIKFLNEEMDETPQLKELLNR